MVAARSAAIRVSYATIGAGLLKGNKQKKAVSFMEIKTERCTVRRFKKEDLDDFIQYRNDENWMQFQGFKGLTKQMYAKELLSEPSFLKGVQLAIINNTTNRLIGDIYLKRE